MNTEKNMVLARKAVKSNDIATIQSMLQSGFDFSEKVKSFPSLISLSISHSKIDILKLMLKQNKTKFLDYIDSNKNLLNEIYCDSQNPVGDKRKVIKFLFDNHNGIKIKNKNEKIVIDIMKSDDVKTFKLLSELHGGFLNSKTCLKSAFMNSIRYSNTQKLAEYTYSKLNENDINKLITWAFENDQHSVVSFFVEQGVDVTVIGKKMVNIYEFLMPLSDETYPAFKLLIDAEKNGKFKTSKTMKSKAALWAAEHGLEKPLMDLISFDINVKAKNSDGNNLLRAFVENYSGECKNDFILLKNLIKLGVDPKFIDCCNDTLLHNIICYNSGDLMHLVDTFELLIKHGVDINATNTDGNTVANSIIDDYDDGMIEFVKYIITKFGADMSIEDNSGLNPLMNLCLTYSGGHKKTKNIVDVIMKCPKIDINAVDCEGMTALMLALDENFFEAACAILKYDVDPSIVDNQGRSAYDYLDEWEHKKRAEIICNLLDDKILVSKSKAGN